MKIKTFFTLALAACGMALVAQNNVVEEVAWVVGDEPIFKSDIEEQYMQAQYERANIDGNPYCVIPEQLAIDNSSCTRPRSIPSRCRLDGAAKC